MRINNFNPNGEAIHPIAYAINAEAYAANLPHIYFHVVGNPDMQVTGLCSMDGRTATNFCVAFNETFFPYGTHTVDTVELPKVVKTPKPSFVVRHASVILWAVIGGAIVWGTLMVLTNPN